MTNSILADANFDVLLDVSLDVSAEIGSRKMPISAILALGAGSVVQFPQLIDEPVHLLVNGRLIARGEILAVDDRFALRITEILNPPAT